MKFLSRTMTFLILFGLGCAQPSKKENTSEVRSLKKVFSPNFHIGVALGESHIKLASTKAIDLVKNEFGSITPENNMKWMNIHPSPNSFSFDIPDKYVTFGENNDMHIVGHTLVWHSQLADWAKDITDSVTMANHLKNHIKTIVGRYKGKINSWDVVNEALNDDGSLRESIFLKTMGHEYLEFSFQQAALADPEAQLSFNDYNMTIPSKRAGAIRLIKSLQDKDVKIDAVGLQGHWSLKEPTIEQIETSILEYSALGIEVLFTELDVTVLPNPWDLEGAEIDQNFEGSEFMNPYPLGLPDSVEVALANRYQDIFELFLKHHEKIGRVTFWGVNDGHTWLNNWPIKNRKNYPLLFDRSYQPKKSYHQVLGVATSTQSK